MKYRPARWLMLALALGCAPRAVDRTIDAGGNRPGRDARLEAPTSPELPRGPDAAASGTTDTGGQAPQADAPSQLPEPPPPPEPPAPVVDAAPARPDFSSAVAASCTGASPWESGKQYEGGDTVIHGEPRRKFECRPWPNTPWCWLPDYEPGRNLFYDDAWIDQGACP
jgi:hypothetical protein